MVFKLNKFSIESQHSHENAQFLFFLKTKPIQYRKHSYTTATADNKNKTTQKKFLRFNQFKRVYQQTKKDE